MSELQPITHEEQQLAAVLNGTEPLKPILHEDLFYAALAKGEVPAEKPITRKEMYLKAIAEKGLGGGGTPINNQDKTITQNGTYTADEGYTGLGKVTVEVAASGGGDSEQVFIDIIEGNATAGPLPEGVTRIDSYAFQKCTDLTELTFKGKPSTLNSSAFTDCTNLLAINVPWAEGEVSGAPWGATNAEIRYNYVAES